MKTDAYQIPSLVGPTFSFLLALGTWSDHQPLEQQPISIVAYEPDDSVSQTVMDGGIYELDVQGPAQQLRTLEEFGNKLLSDSIETPDEIAELLERRFLDLV